MKKLGKILTLLLLLASAFWFGTVITDRQTIQSNLIRLHVIANSDSEEDQNLKLKVRDAITARLESVMAEFNDLDSAKAYLQENLSELQNIANEVLESAGDDCRAVVTLAKSAFPKREYDTFTLPAGVYESLRITIGDGEGQNWWCVVFPNLCVSATTDGFEDTAVSAGFTDRLAGTLTGESQYRVRFFVMDCIGWVENWFYRN